MKDLSSFSNPHYDLHMHDSLIAYENEKMVLNHGDLNPGNIIVDDNNSDGSYVSTTRYGNIKKRK